MSSRKPLTLAGAGTDRAADRAAASAPTAAAGLDRLTGPLLGLVRIAIGILWFTQARWKIGPDLHCGPQKDGGLCYWVRQEIESPRFGWYRAFLTEVFFPNIATLGWLVVLGEVLTAILLTFGLLTRLGGVLGFVQGINLLIGLWAVPHEWYWTYIMLALLNLTLALTAAGRWLGADALLRPRAAAAGARGSRLGRLVAALT